MGERTVKIYDCDLCGEKNLSNAIKLAVIIDRRSDAVGSMENWYGQVWVCESCAFRLLRQFLKKLDHGEAQEWLKPFIRWEEC